MNFPGYNFRSFADRDDLLIPELRWQCGIAASAKIEVTAQHAVSQSGTDDKKVRVISVDRMSFVLGNLS